MVYIVYFGVNSFDLVSICGILVVYGIDMFMSTVGLVLVLVLHLFWFFFGV